jgi:hypothetical protein
MTSRNKSDKPKFQWPFAPLPLIEGEDATAYQDLLARARADLQPTDIVEQIWTREIVDLAWEVLRWRRVKDNLIQATLPEGLDAVLSPIGWGDLVEGWTWRKPRAIKKVDRILEALGLSIDAVTAQTLAVNLDKVERIDGLIASATRRLLALVRELEHRQLARRGLSLTGVQQLEHDECSVIGERSADERVEDDQPAQD